MENIRLEHRAELGRLGLTYSLDDVARCIRSLHPDDYHKNISYDNPIPMGYDIYKTHFQPENADCEDYLYLKVRLEDGIIVIVGSFKLV